MNERVEKELKVDQNKSKEYSEDVTKLLSIEELMKMTNKEYQSKILAVFVTYWNIFGKVLLDQKDNILKATQSIVDDDPTFFSLAFQLIERKHNLFEKDFSYFVDLTKNAYGHYCETILKPIVRLLLRISKKQKMNQVRAFIFRKCPYIEINSEPLTNFQEFYKFNSMNIYPFDKKELHIFVSFKVKLII